MPCDPITCWRPSQDVESEFARKALVICLIFRSTSFPNLKQPITVKIPCLTTSCTCCNGRNCYVDIHESMCICPCWCKQYKQCTRQNIQNIALFCSGWGLFTSFAPLTQLREAALAPLKWETCKRNFESLGAESINVTKGQICKQTYPRQKHM